MRAMQVQYADVPAAVAKDDQILPEDAHPQWRGTQFMEIGDGMPETAQVFPSGRAPTRLNDLHVRCAGDLGAIA